MRATAIIARMGITGPKSRYRGKVRRPVVFTFTPEGHAALAEGTRRTGMSRADYVEFLLRRAAARSRHHPESVETAETADAILS